MLSLSPVKGGALIRPGLILLQFWLLAIVTVSDYRRRQVANRWLLLLAVAGTALVQMAGGGPGPGAALAGLAVCALPFACLYYLSDDMGGADVKFAAVCGWIHGARRGLLILLAGLLLIAIVYGLSARRRAAVRSRGIPLLTWLAPFHGVALLLLLA
ncbi:MAG: prepilin peptidase [Bacillota bacterium]|nr:prepilin peptidase [Bacillota bacterium]